MGWQVSLLQKRNKCLCVCLFVCIISDMIQFYYWSDINIDSSSLCHWSISEMEIKIHTWVFMCWVSEGDLSQINFLDFLEEKNLHRNKAKLTFSERRAAVCFRPTVEQNEGLGRWSTREVNHLHGALQREFMPKVEQALVLDRYTSLRCHLLKKDWHPGDREEKNSWPW